MPSTRTTIYRELLQRDHGLSHATRNNNKSVRWLVQFIPAEASPLLASEVTYEDLPPGTFLDHSIGDAQFKEGIFIGHPDAEERTIRINYRACPDDFRDWLTTDSTVTATIEGETFFVSGVFIFSHDGGDATLDMEDFTVEYIGVHRHQGRATYSLQSKGGPIEIEITLQHIGKALLEAISIEALRTRVIDTYGANLTMHKNLFTRLYKVTGHGRAYGLVQTGRNVHFAWLLPLSFLSTAIADLMAAAMAVYLRTDDPLAWSDSEAGWLDATPWRYSWEMYEQLYDGSRDIGDALTDPWTNFGKFVAVISNTASPADLTSTGQNWIGGQLGGSVINGQAVGRGDDSLFVFANCYSLVKAIAENAGEKHLPVVGYSGTAYSAMIEACLLTADSNTGGVPWATVAPEDFTGTIQWTPNELDLRGAEAKIPGAGADDLDTVSYSSTATIAEKGFEITTVLHNLPLNGDARQRLDNPNVGGTVIQGGLPLTGNYSLLSVFNTGFDTRGIYYEATPTFASEEIAILVHPGCTYRYGLGSSGPSPDVRQLSLYLEGFDYPSVADAGPYGATTKGVYDPIFQQLMATVIQDQRSINMLSAIARTIVRLFARTPLGNPHGTAKLSGTLIGRWPASIVGRRLLLSDGADGFTLTGTDTTLWDATPSQRSVVVTSCKPDDVTGTAAIVAVATNDDEFYINP